MFYYARKLCGQNSDRVQRWWLDCALQLSRATVGDASKDWDASDRRPGSSGGSVSPVSGFWAVVTWRLCPAGLLSREPTCGLSMWLGHLSAGQLCLKGEHSEPEHSKWPRGSSIAFLWPLCRRHIASLLPHFISWSIQKPSRFNGKGLRP